MDAKIRSNVNPYFGVYKEPTYKVSVQMSHLSEAQWKKIIQKLSQKASFISRLLLNEIPENIETVFESVGTHLLPNDYKDFKVSCDCPDYEVPCKHIAGVCYCLAGLMDNDPFLLFEMRGLSPEKLLQQLANTPLGKILSDAKSNVTAELTPVNSFYTRPLLVTNPPQHIKLNNFWHGQ